MDIRENWQNTRFESTPTAEYDSIVSGRLRHTALDRLKQRYQRFAMVGIMMVIVFGIMTMTGRFERIFVTENIWFMITWMAYFATAAIMDTWLYYGLSKINLTTMSVSEVSRLALYYRKRHIQFIFVLLPWALAVVGWFISIAIDDKYLVCGIISGMLVGLCIGARALMGFLKEYRELSE